MGCEFVHATPCGVVKVRFSLSGVDDPATKQVLQETWSTAQLAVGPREWNRDQRCRVCVDGVAVTAAMRTCLELAAPRD